MQRPIVTCSCLGHNGRLGNQLFQIAATIGAARQHDYDFRLPAWKPEKYFVHSLPLRDGNVQLPQHNEHMNFLYRRIVLDGSTDLYGFFQSERYFDHCLDEVREVFKKREDVATHPACDKDACSIHVRRDDYLKYTDVFNVLEMNYYETAMELQSEAKRFIVFSDDIAWCRENFRGPNITFMEQGEPVLDVFSMAACGSHIIANSSFSWWGAWLNPDPDKKVIAPRWWLSESYPYPCGKDMVPPSWQRI